jgi:hypothetical protein
MQMQNKECSDREMMSIIIKRDGNSSTELIIDHNDPIILRTSMDTGMGMNSLRRLTEEQENEISSMILPIQSYIEESRRRRSSEELFSYFMECEQEHHEFPLQVHGEGVQGFIHVTFKCFKDLRPNSYLQFKAGNSYDLFNTVDGSVVFREFDEAGELIDTYDMRSTYKTEYNFYLYNAFRMMILEDRTAGSEDMLPHVVRTKDSPGIDNITDFKVVYKSQKWTEYWDKTIGIPEWQAFS